MTLKTRRILESTATFGLLLLVVSLAAPFASSFADGGILGMIRSISIFKWIFAAGALIFTIARMAGSTDRSESLRLRRLRRLEFWAGVAFCVAAFFWFYNCRRFGVDTAIYPSAGPLAIMRDTIMFSLVGALIQVIASWMIYYRARKEEKAAAAASGESDSKPSDKKS